VTNEVTPETLAPDGGIAVVESQLLVVTSDTVLRRAIVAAHLDTDPEFGGSPAGFAGELRNRLAGLGIDLDAGDRGDPELKALRQLKKRIGVKRSDKAYVVDIYVTTEGKEKSVRVADAIAQAYLDDQTNARATASGALPMRSAVGSMRCAPACRRRKTAPCSIKSSTRSSRPAAFW